MKIIKSYYEIEKLADGKEILRRIERAGRTCWKSEDMIAIDSAEKFVRMIMKKGHYSVIEHDDMTVRFICDRGVTHELVRHRLVAYSQESTRYCNYSKGKYESEITVIEPCFWKEGAMVKAPDIDRYKEYGPLYVGGLGSGLVKPGVVGERYGLWKQACIRAEKIYLELIEKGATPQEARSVLPNSLKTEIVTTANLREWRHIFTLRTSKAAHPQMREIMVPLLKEVQRRVPVLFEDIIPFEG